MKANSMTQAQLILLFGATGSTGKATTLQLLANIIPIRVFVPRYVTENDITQPVDPGRYVQEEGCPVDKDPNCGLD